MENNTFKIFLIKMYRRVVFNLIKVVIKLGVFFVSLVEVPIFLLRNPHIFKNKIIYPFWQWSFGHEISALDFGARLYQPHRISLLYVHYPLVNKYLPECFSRTMDVFYYKSIIPAGKGRWDSAKYSTLRFVLLLISGIFSKFHVIEQINIYKTLSVAENRLMLGVEEKGRLIKDADWTGYIRLLRDKIGRMPEMPDSLVNRCKKAILKNFPHFFDKKFAIILLRKKGFGSEFSNEFRSAGPHENYRDAVKFLTQHGYNVVGTGETQHKYFCDISGYYSLEDVDIDKDLLNLFLLMHCSFFIGQMSGAYILPSSCGILCLITDSMSYRLGTFGDQNIILFKHLRDKNLARILSIVEVFRQHKDLAFGYNFKKKNIEIEPDTPEEILEAVQECVGIIEGRFRTSDEDKKLIEKFRELPSPEMHLYYQRNRPPLFTLRKLKNELYEN